MSFLHWTGDDEPAGIATSPLLPASRRVLDLTEFPDLLESLERRDADLRERAMDVTEREKELRQRAAALAQWQRSLVCWSVSILVSAALIINAAQELVK